MCLRCVPTPFPPFAALFVIDESSPAQHSSYSALVWRLNSQIDLDCSISSWYSGHHSTLLHAARGHFCNATTQEINIEKYSHNKCKARWSFVVKCAQVFISRWLSGVHFKMMRHSFDMVDRLITGHVVRECCWKLYSLRSPPPLWE